MRLAMRFTPERRYQKNLAPGDQAEGSNRDVHALAGFRKRVARIHEFKDILARIPELAERQVEVGALFRRRAVTIMEARLPCRPIRHRRQVDVLIPTLTRPAEVREVVVNAAREV